MKFVNRRPLDSALLIMGSGALIISIGIIALRGYFGVGDTSSLDLYLIMIGTAAGACVIISGALSLVFPDRSKLLGVVTMIFSVLSFPGTSGGLYIGAIGGLLGGIMGISWKRKETDKNNGVDSAQKSS